MTYITGTLTDSDAPATLYGSIATALSSAGYTLEDTVVITTTTWKVWKSPAASNSANLDWYLYVGYTTTGAGTVRFYCSEDYTAETDLVIRGVIAPNSSNSNYGSNKYYSYTSGAGVYDATTGSPYGATGYAINHGNWSWDSGVNLATRAISCPATSFGYWISLTTDRVIVLGSANPTELIYTGLYVPNQEYLDIAAANTALDPATPTIFPLVSLKINASSYNGGSQPYNGSGALLTRLGGFGRPTISPALTNTYAYWAGTLGWTSSPECFGRLPDGLAGNGVTIPGWNTRLNTQKMCVMINVVGYAIFTVGTLHGVYESTAASSVTRGDTVTVGGINCVVTTPVSSNSSIFEAI